ncbi:MAG: tRNA (guanosine(37)-N1)-methyltransferase TrmD [Candidatus Roizmanbacteria bacterium]|nr:tRNA (guanosine(37)-N1)-methyltransferase TrmD [Candidatus Roizmanbacteria bacterium]
MHITILTLFPDMLSGFLNESIVKRAQAKKAVSIDVINIRDFAIDAYGTVDDHVYGGGAGMLMRVDVLSKAISSLTQKKHHGENTHIVLTSARGETYTQKHAKRYAKLEHLLIIAGHYEGVDERIMQHVDEEISIGDFVLTGGELPAAMLIDSVVRLLPGVLEKETATTEETFQEVLLDEIKRAGINDVLIEKLERKGIQKVRLLEYPQYTRPQEFDKQEVPAILLSGDHKKIAAWRLKQAWVITKKRRPDLL